MGTRGLLGYTRKDGTRKGCFNGANSYKEGLGNDIADFLRSLKPEDFDLMAERIEQIEWVQEDEVPDFEIKTEYVSNGFHKDALRYSPSPESPKPEETVEVTAAGIQKWKTLLSGFDSLNHTTLPFIKDGKLRHLIDRSDFANDDTWCEWVYYIDFNNRLVQYYGSGSVVSFDKLIAEPEWFG